MLRCRYGCRSGVFKRQRHWQEPNQTNPELFFTLPLRPQSAGYLVIPSRVTRVSPILSVSLHSHPSLFFLNVYQSSSRDSESSKFTEKKHGPKHTPFCGRFACVDEPSFCAHAFTPYHHLPPWIIAPQFHLCPYTIALACTIIFPHTGHPVPVDDVNEAAPPQGQGYLRELLQSPVQVVSCATESCCLPLLTPNQ